MKVETDLRAGGVLDDAARQASETAGQVSSFLTEADQQAESLTTSVVNTATSFWNCLTNSLS